MCQWYSSVQEAFFQTCQYLSRCGENGIILYPLKFVFAEDTVNFVGFEIGKDYVKASKKFHTALGALRWPETLTDVRPFFGLVEQVSYTFYSSDIMQPF